jgi:hypothetical protein
MPVMDFLEFLNPLKYFSHEGYQSFWRTLFATVLQGFWARLFAASFLFLAFWFGVRRQRFQIGFAYFVISVAMTYGATVLRFLGFR